MIGGWGGEKKGGSGAPESEKKRRKGEERRGEGMRGSAAPLSYSSFFSHV